MDPGLICFASRYASVTKGQSHATDELRLWFLVESPIHPAFAGDPLTPQVAPHVRALLNPAMTRSTREQLQTSSGIRDREHFRKQYLSPLLEAKLLEMTIPDKPRSRLQQYRTTSAGRKALLSRKLNSRSP